MIEGKRYRLVSTSAAQLRLTAFGSAVALLCALGSDDSEQLPELLPPHGELPPGFWDLYTWHFVAGVCALLGFLALVVWWWVRPKASLPPPPAETAREALEPLVREEETGPVLSRVSQVVRGYFGTVFGFPPGELTTSEFANAVKSSQQAESDLSEQAVKLLRTCDERKFAPTPPVSPLGAAAEALHLINECEAQRATALAQSQAQGSVASAAAPNGKEVV